MGPISVIPKRFHKPSEMRINPNIAAVCQIYEVGLWARIGVGKDSMVHESTNASQTVTIDFAACIPPTRNTLVWKSVW